MTTDRIFEALSSSARRQILAYLSAGELTAGQISERFSMSAPAISRHLSLLETAGLVFSERRGQFVMYRLNGDNLVNTLTGFAFEMCPTARPLKREARKLAKRKAPRS
jgi:DNA-binding transcriptional ArsR family regulator